MDDAADADETTSGDADADDVAVGTATAGW